MRCEEAVFIALEGIGRCALANGLLEALESVVKVLETLEAADTRKVGGNASGSICANKAFFHGLETLFATPVRLSPSFDGMPMLDAGRCCRE